MTIGSWNRDSYYVWPSVSVKIGYVWSRSWNGADETKKVYPRAPPQYVLREKKLKGGRTVVKRYRVLRQDPRLAKPPKRAQHSEHAYSMSENRSFEELVTPKTPSNFASYPVLWAHGNPNTSVASLLDANDQIKLVGKLRDKLQGSDFNMSVFLGEGHQTLELLGDTAIRLAKALHHMKKGDLLGTARVLMEGTSRAPLGKHDWKNGANGRYFKALPEKLSSHWLELQYGWKPLLEDAAGAAQMLAHNLNVPFQSTYRVVSRKEATSVRVSQVGTFGPSRTASAQSVRVHSRSIIARVSEDLSSVAKLGLLDPELVAWELLPFSFVADWFIPIGDWMATRALASRLKGTFITSDKRMGIGFSPQSKWFTSPVRANVRNVSFTRSISTTLAVPMPTFKGLQKAASWQHCANAVALLTGLASGHPTKGRGF